MNGEVDKSSVFDVNRTGVVMFRGFFGMANRSVTNTGFITTTTKFV